MAGRWFSPGTPVSPTYKTYRHDITEILLKVVLNTINLPIIDKTVDYVYSVYHITRVSYSHSTESRNNTQFYNLCIYDRPVEHYIGCKHLSILLSIFRLKTDVIE